MTTELDYVNQGNYRPIDNIQHLQNNGKSGKWKMERLTNYVENKGNYQSGFRKGTSTTDPALSLEHEIRKALINRESVVALFFDTVGRSVISNTL